MTPAATEPTRAELYERARRLDVPGRSSMDKAQLAAALRERDGERAGGAAREGGDGAPGAAGSGHGPRNDLADGVASRVEQFAELASRAARGELVMLPRALTGDDRRLHVRQGEVPQVGVVQAHAVLAARLCREMARDAQLRRQTDHRAADLLPAQHL